MSPKSGAAGRITYHIASGNHGNVFELASGGILRIKEGLDYEERQQYQLWLEARDGDTTALSDYTLVTVELTDTNDNAPAFSEYVYTVSILEEQPPPLFIFKVNATDADSGANGEVQYRLLTQGNTNSAFSIDATTGEIMTAITLDHETVASYKLTVEATDKGKPPLVGSATVLVTVVDKNDNPPRFTRLFNEAVMENSLIGTFIVQVTSSDGDEGVNANSSYYLTKNPGNRFSIEERSGNLTVAAELDREEQEEYSLIVLAVDEYWRIETPLTITLLDENDNKPMFENDLYIFEYPEMSPPFSYIGQVSATDLDKQGPNSEVRYSFKLPSEHFAIDPESGDILAKTRFQYERKAGSGNKHDLTVVAMDNGIPRLSSEVSVIIHIVDANNYSPVFREPIFSSLVPENTPVGKSILQVSKHL